MNRRRFIATAAASAMTLARRSIASPAASRISPAAQPLELQQVRLRPGPFLDAAQINRRYMMSLEPDRLLHTFRINNGMPSSAEPLGGWEQPANELRGHFTGHYLSACALMSASQSDDALKERGNRIVSELAKCQKAHGNGYLSAFPEEFFDRLRAGQDVWAPFYTLHKVMAGMLDMHTYGGNEQALDVLKGMARWTEGWCQPLGEPHMARVLEREYGGMNEVLYNLYAVTGEERWLDLAHRFDHERIFAPLAEQRDELKGLHVNTNIPKIIGAARRYELTGDTRYRDIADYFWREVTGRRSYCTGGTSNDEGWGSDPGKLSRELGGYTQECCCTYNMLKLTQHMFSWTADPHAADYYERALFNGILGTQHPSDGMTIYYVPLASGYWKLFGLPLDAFWCCTGTGVETFSKLGNSIYFRDDDGLYVNLFIASEAAWPEKGVRIVQDTSFPEQEGTTLTVKCDRPASMALRVRVPWWTKGGAAKLNGRPLETFASPSGYLVVNRTWQDGDKLEIALPMTLQYDPMPDDQSVRAIMYGPIVLAGHLGTQGLTKDVLRAEPTKLKDIPHYRSEPVPAPQFRAAAGEPQKWVQSAGKPLEFRTAGLERNIELSPLYRIIDERYAVYWKFV